MKYRRIKAPNRDCQFYDKNRNNCKGLNDLYCAIDEKPCSFYKKQEADAAGQQVTGKL
jgi:hypothetical protein